MERPEAARLSNKQAMNFLFVGNPGIIPENSFIQSKLFLISINFLGTGKTTVARLLADILVDLGVRKQGSFEETTGQKLLTLGSKKSSDLIKKVTPGVLFVDEIYQLDPKSNQEGRAITNAIMDASENDRDKLTFIAAGYKDDVREKWLASNPGLSSRFPIEVTFEDFGEEELRKVFLGIVRELQWTIENYVHPSDPTLIVDVAQAAARRLARGANKKGFANARSVRVLVEQSLKRASQRQKSEKVNSNQPLPKTRKYLSLVFIYPNESILSFQMARLLHFTMFWESLSMHLRRPLSRSCLA